MKVSKYSRVNRLSIIHEEQEIAGGFNCESVGSGVVERALPPRCEIIEGIPEACRLKSFSAEIENRHLSAFGAAELYAGFNRDKYTRVGVDPGINTLAPIVDQQADVA